MGVLSLPTSLLKSGYELMYPDFVSKLFSSPSTPTLSTLFWWLGKWEAA
jgi:hypothetical protein